MVFMMEDGKVLYKDGKFDDASRWRLVTLPTKGNVIELSYDYTEGVLYALTDLDETFISGDKGETWKLLENNGILYSTQEGRYWPK